MSILKAVALDAMGVIFEDGDDVAARLVPFVQARNPSVPRAAIVAHYVLSLGQVTAAQFWRMVGLPEDSDAAYLGTLRLDPTFLTEAHRWPGDLLIGMISNDAAEWSRELRRRHGLDALLRKTAISGECGSRKPSEPIYRRFLEAAEVEPTECLLVDDKVINLVAARGLGFRVALFHRGDVQRWDGLRVSSFSELTTIVARMAQP